eukprot:COSAG05_NODE_1144_length_5733_cov_162.189208_3_plen_98_part_00
MANRTPGQQALAYKAARERANKLRASFRRKNPRRLQQQQQQQQQAGDSRCVVSPLPLSTAVCDSIASSSLPTRHGPSEERRRCANAPGSVSHRFGLQ